MLTSKLKVEVFLFLWTLTQGFGTTSQRYVYAVDNDEVQLEKVDKILSLHNETVVELPSFENAEVNIYEESKILNETKVDKSEKSDPPLINNSNPVLIGEDFEDVVIAKHANYLPQNEDSIAFERDSSNAPDPSSQDDATEASSYETPLPNVVNRESKRLDSILRVLRDGHFLRELRKAQESLLGNIDDDSTSSESEENSAESLEGDKIGTSKSGKKGASTRQFVFHPYLPYSKDVMPDEKISFHDILPVKMVKFIKSMVEEAPWEQMFMKMVRMIVDQFVDKIIEKMFAHKDEEHDKWRSLDVLVAPTWVLPTYSTPVVRLRRSTDGQKKENPVVSLLASNRMSKELVDAKTEFSEERTWLDSVLDYLFPDEPTKHSDAGLLKNRDKRDMKPRVKTLKELIARYIENSEASSKTLNETDSKLSLKAWLRNKMLKEILSILFVRKDINNAKFPDTKLPSEMEPKRSERHKRSVEGASRRLGDEKRLWQASQKARPTNQRRDECSLRNACNAGRLLSRLPSVKEITLQLRTYGDEPHWDALLWGMKKKRCSRIFCKRQRSPKGSKHPWDSPSEGHRKSLHLVRSSSEGSPEDSDLVTP